MAAQIQWSSREVNSAMWIILAICAAAVAFYVRFFVALCKECNQTRTCYLVCIVATGDEDSALQPMREETISKRAA